MYVQLSDELMIKAVNTGSLGHSVEDLLCWLASADCVYIYPVRNSERFKFFVSPEPLSKDQLDEAERELPRAIAQAEVDHRQRAAESTMELMGADGEGRELYRCRICGRVQRFKPMPLRKHLPKFCGAGCHLTGCSLDVAE